jgi:hypothetical protein
VTLYRQINITDSWKVDEVHAQKFSDGRYHVRAKLKNGRTPGYIFMGIPDEGQEKAIVKMLYKIDRWDRFKEFFSRPWNRLRHSVCCDH